MSEAILPFDPAHLGTGRKATGGRQLQSYRMSEAFIKFADAYDEEKGRLLSHEAEEYHERLISHVKDFQLCGNYLARSCCSCQCADCLSAVEHAGIWAKLLARL